MKRKTNFKQMFLVDNSFISRVNNENRVSVSNTFSPIQGGEVIGSKDDECKECSFYPSTTPSNYLAKVYNSLVFGSNLIINCHALWEEQFCQNPLDNAKITKFI